VPNIFIADDSEPVLRTLRKFLASDPRFTVVGEARNYDEALRLVSELKPDIILADLRMPGAYPDEEGLGKLVALCQCPVIVMSFTADAETNHLAKSVGAARLLDKMKLNENLIPAIDEVLGKPGSAQ
jgi:DNA-binding NarL/FixJ family response regulator